MAEQQPTARVKTKKKAWFTIVAPPLFNQQEIGETYLGSPQEAVGRAMRYNVKELTGNIKDQNMYLTLRLENIVGTVIHTHVLGCEITPVSIKRMIRKDAERIDDCYIVHTKEGASVVIKSVLITLRKVQRSLQTRLRKMLQEALREEALGVDFPQFVGNVITGKVKATVLKKLNTVYPLREFAVRRIELQGKRAELAANESTGSAVAEAV